MKGKKLKLVIIFLIFNICLIGITSYAHSGRTDSSGGHRDNKNKSGLGSYHYHCGGHPAHLHPNGVCPYSSKSSSKKSSSSSSKSSSSKKTTSNSTVKKPTTVAVTGIEINNSVNSIKVGRSETLTATIKPNNATDKNITWKSSDESIATVNANGKVTAKKPGTVDITATTSNGKNNTIKINIKEEEKSQNTNAIKTSTTSKNNLNNHNTDNTQEDSGVVAGILGLGLLGGGGYLGYKKYKNK